MRTCIFTLLSAAASAAAQCTPQWSALGMGCNWDVYSMEVDTSLAPGASRLLVVGYFGATGGGEANRMAAWDTRIWTTPLGQLDKPPALLDDAAIVPAGSFPTTSGYYIAGQFNSVAGTPAKAAARWDNTAWSPVGSIDMNIVVHRLGVYDERPGEPGGNALYLAGDIIAYHGQPAEGILRWDGTDWRPLNPLLVKPNNDPFGHPSVHALVTYDDDGTQGPRVPGLYVGGWFKGAGTLESRNIIRWDGAQWEGLGAGTNDTVYSLCPFDDDGPGPRRESLFVSGSFSHAGGFPSWRIARWDGHEWTSLPVINSNARDMLVWDDDGSGPNQPALYATGYFNSPGAGIARWRGLGHPWEPLGTGLTEGVGVTYGLCLSAWDEDGPGPNPGGLYVGGHFTMAGSAPANYIARWGCPLPPGGPCYPDCNQDGALNLSDFGCFQTKFATADPYADCNQDGVRNLSDFGCFQTKFALGCP